MSASGNGQVQDLLVIGGGVNGCGIARDATGRGLAVTLVEKGDLAGATSSSSTKLIHGGLRYLEYYEFSLVRKALREREVRRERAYSHERGPQYEHYRYVEPARSESSFGGGRGYGGRERSRSRVNVGYGRERSRSRGSYVDERTRVTIVDDDGRRRRDYR